MLSTLQPLRRKKLLCIDPGLRCLGVSFFDNGTLQTAFLLKNNVGRKRGAVAWRGMIAALNASIGGIYYDAMILEKPKQYEGGKNKVNRADLMELMAIAGACAVVSTAQVIDIYPRVWKGQVPKHVTCLRLLGSDLAAARVASIPRLPRPVAGALSADECARIVWPAKSLAHNVVDAIGIGYWATGR